MTDRPILFSAPMVRALLNGTKTQTRRILKPQPSDFQGAKVPPAGKSWVNKKFDAPFLALHDDLEHWCWWDEYANQGPDWIKVRFAKGDRLWVKETHRIRSWGEDGEVWLGYKADDAKSPCLYRDNEDFLERLCGKLEKAGVKTGADGLYADVPPALLSRPSLFMPRWASRLTLEVSDVRVERLQDISEADAFAEGLERMDHTIGPDGSAVPLKKPLAGNDGWGSNGAGSHSQHGWDDPRGVYADLWESINGPGSWDANPFVVAVSFSVHRGNIDQMARAS